MPVFQLTMEKMKLVISYPLQFLRRDAVQKVSGALFTQSMLSLTNFVVGFSVAKYAAKSEYGIYVILFSIVGLVGGYQNALVNSPLTVLAPKKKPDEEVLFLSGLGFGQWLLFLPLALFTIIIVSTYSFFHGDFSLLKYAAALTLSTLTFLLREFIRTVNYSKLRMHLLIKMDALFVLFIFLGIWVIVLSNKVTSTSSITVLGIGYFLAAVFGNFYGSEEYRIKWKSIKSAFRETWQYSKWAMLGVTSDIFKNRGYIYIVTLFLGLEKIAEISAARLFLMPIGLLVVSSGKITLAKGAEVFNVRGADKFKKFILGITSFLIIAWVGYFLAVWIFHDYLISILGNEYENIGIFFLLWGVFFLVYSLRFPLTNALQVCKEFKALANYDVIVALITVVSCFLLVRTMGSQGAIISLIAGELVLLICAAARLLLFLRLNISDEGSRSSSMNSG